MAASIMFDSDKVSTWKVKECVEDVEAFCVIALDKLVGVELSDVRPGREQRNIMSTYTTRFIRAQ